MVVLDVIHKIQAEHAPDLACRWNCKGKVWILLGGSGSKSRLMCMTRMSDTIEETPNEEPVTIRPSKVSTDKRSSDRHELGLRDEQKNGSSQWS